MHYIQKLIITPHEKAIHIIDLFGIKPKKEAEIIGKSQSVVYDKLKGYASNKFLDEQLKFNHSKIRVVFCEKENA